MLRKRTFFQRRLLRRAGFTMVELLVVLAIIVVLTALGIGLSDDVIPRWRTKAAARRLVTQINQCRSLAVRSNRECSVWLITSDAAPNDIAQGNAGEYWVGMGNADRDSSSWDYLPVDSVTDGTDDNVSEGTVDLADTSGPYYARHVSIADWGSGIGGPGSGNTNRIVFSPMGFATNPSSDFNTSGYIEVKFVNKRARQKGRTEDFRVLITRSGMARMDSSVVPEFDDFTVGTSSGSSL